MIQEACANKKTCTLPASSGYFGDPCPGTFKYLEAHFQCMPDSYLNSGNGNHNTRSRNQGSRTAQNGGSSNRALNTPPPIVIPSQLPSLEGSSLLSTPKSSIESRNQQPNQAVIEARKEATLQANKLELERLQAMANSAAVLRSSPASPTIVTMVTEAKDIYVKHPYPRMNFPGGPSAGNRQTQNQNKPSASQENQDSQENVSQSPENHKTTSREDSKAGILSNLSPTSMSLLHDHCPPTYSGGMSWNWTRAGVMAFLPCPAGAKGAVRWFCAQTSDTPEWVPSARPDFSDCSSVWVQNIVERINKGESFVNLANELAELTRIESTDGKSSSSRNLFGGDLFRTADIVNQLVVRMEDAFELFSDDRQKNQLAKELLQVWIS